MSKIIKTLAREVLDSRGNPTVEVEVTTKDGFVGRGISPSGASVGSREAVELRDNDPSRFCGKGVTKAVDHVNKIIALKINNFDVHDQRLIDQSLIDLDATKNKSYLGANAILAVSIACLDAAAKSNNKMVCEYLNPSSAQMPVPLMNIINGGAHANNGLDIQEFMIVPHALSSIREAIRCGAEIFHHLKQKLKDTGLSVAVGDEGGFAPDISHTRKVLDLVVLSIAAAGYEVGKDVSIALDVAASEFYREGVYQFKNSTKYTYQELIEFYKSLIKDYPIISIEDGMDEKDVNGWQELTSAAGGIQLVGDDVFVTNLEILKEAVKNKIANAILIKPNQIGTISETLDVIKLAKKNNYNCVMSHRSGETEDTIISHLAVATGCKQIKTGSLCRVDRTAKYNELMRIEDRLKGRSYYAGF
ncbi:MAG: phosphopyruvate hydratase [Rickettsiales bacterium]